MNCYTVMKCLSPGFGAIMNRAYIQFTKNVYGTGIEEATSMPAYACRESKNVMVCTSMHITWSSRF
jgi:hypothetical protein